MAPKTTSTHERRGAWLRGIALTATVAGLLLGSGGGTLAAPKPSPGVVALHQDDGESKIVPRGSQGDAGDQPSDDDVSADETPAADPTPEASDGEPAVRFSGIAKPGAFLEPNQWAGVFDGRLVEAFEQPAAPARLTIGGIGIDAPVTTREIVDGQMQTPSDEHEVTWYKETGRPGQPGNMVFAGHLNWYGVPEAVFFRIGHLQKGDEITVTGADGQVYTYRVTWVKLIPVDGDVAKIVGSTKKPSLTLITCGGQWDASLGQYGHRTVVRAELATS